MFRKLKPAFSSQGFSARGEGKSSLYRVVLVFCSFRIFLLEGLLNFGSGDLTKTQRNPLFGRGSVRIFDWIFPLAHFVEIKFVQDFPLLTFLNQIFRKQKLFTLLQNLPNPACRQAGPSLLFDFASLEHARDRQDRRKRGDFRIRLHSFLSEARRSERSRVKCSACRLQRI